MKVLGKINVGGVDVHQAHSIPNNIDFSAKTGSYLYSDPLNVYEKSKKGWVRTTFRMMFMNILSWAVTILNSDERTRKILVKQVFESVAHYKQGELSPEGEELVADLKANYKVIGFTPSVTYLMNEERGEDSLNSFWEHPFSMPTLLLKHKTLPILVLTNGNIDFNDSRLLKMRRMDKLEVDEVLEGEYEFEKDEKISGITG